MAGKRHSVPACVQTLESRRLCSAAVPTLTGTPFTGTIGAGTAADITIVVAQESRTGRISGTFTETSGGNVNVRSFSGAVNSHGRLVLHIRRQVVSVSPRFVIKPQTLTGTVSADGNTMTGTSNAGGFRTTFMATRTP
jgi:hypothetical protein